MLLAGDLLTLMHPDTFDQITVDPGIFGSQRSLLKEGADVTVNLLDGEPISGACLLLLPGCKSCLLVAVIMQPHKPGAKRCMLM